MELRDDMKKVIEKHGREVVNTKAFTRVLSDYSTTYNRNQKLQEVFDKFFGNGYGKRMIAIENLPANDRIRGLHRIKIDFITNTGCDTTTVNALIDDLKYALGWSETRGYTPASDPKPAPAPAPKPVPEPKYQAPKPTPSPAPQYAPLGMSVSEKFAEELSHVSSSRKSEFIINFPVPDNLDDLIGFTIAMHARALSESIYSDEYKAKLNECHNKLKVLYPGDFKAMQTIKATELNWWRKLPEFAKWMIIMGALAVICLIGSTFA